MRIILCDISHLFLFTAITINKYFYLPNTINRIEKKDHLKERDVESQYVEES